MDKKDDERNGNSRCNKKGSNSNSKIDNQYLKFALDLNTP
jgi:hypothetical protein